MVEGVQGYVDTNNTKAFYNAIKMVFGPSKDG